MNDFQLPHWFVDHDIKGRRPIYIMRKNGIEPSDPFGQMVLIEFMAARQRATTHPVKSPWALFNRLVTMAARGLPSSLGHSAEGEKIKERLGQQGVLK